MWVYRVQQTAGVGVGVPPAAGRGAVTDVAASPVPQACDEERGREGGQEAGGRCHGDSGAVCVGYLRRSTGQKKPLSGGGVPLSSQSPDTRALCAIGLWEATVRALRQCRSRWCSRSVADAPPTS